MSKNKIWLIILVVVLALAGIDAVRYLKPTPDHKKEILGKNSFSPDSARAIVLAYNAYGGIFPGLVDVIHKEIFPDSYPCNLCYLSFGTFSIKKEWKDFLDSLPYQKIELHKDQFRRQNNPQDFALPAILLKSKNQTEILVSAEEINRFDELDELMMAVRSKL